MEYGEALNSKADLYGRDGIDILARMIYGEAEGECFEGKCGCAFVAKNRKDRNSKEFGFDTWEGVLLKPGQFSGLDRPVILKPDTSSQAWTDSLYIAQNLSDQDNPIGGCLWFNGNEKYNERVSIVNGEETYTFASGSARKVVEKYVIEGHTFFKLSGY